MNYPTTSIDDKFNFISKLLTLPHIFIFMKKIISSIIIMHMDCGSSTGGFRPPPPHPLPYWISPTPFSYLLSSSQPTMDGHSRLVFLFCLFCYASDNNRYSEQHESFRQIESCCC